MKRIILTGNIASGKSTAVEHLKQLDYPVWSADEAVHALLASHEVETEIRRHFDKPVLQSEETLQNMIRQHLFTSSKFQRWYLPWIHAHVAKRLQEDMSRLSWRPSSGKVMFLDIPLFFESAQSWVHLDQIWLVWTPLWLRRWRWEQRFHASREIMDKISQWQIPDEEKFQKADIILVNTLEKSILGQQISNALELLR